jgi:hypothetical protein
MTQDVTRRIITSSRAYGRWIGWLAHVEVWKIPRRANIWLMDAALALGRATISLRGA